MMPAAVAGQKNNFHAADLAFHEMVRGPAKGRVQDHQLLAILDPFHFIQSAAADDADL